MTDESTQTVNVKSIRSAAWDAAKARAAANGETLGAWVSRACEQLAGLEAGGPRLYPPEKPESDAPEPANPLVAFMAWCAAYKAAKEASAPRDITAELARRMASCLGHERPKPPARRTGQPPLLTDRRDAWRENGSLTAAPD